MPIVVTIETLGKDATEQQIGYFRKFLLPTFRKAMWEHGERHTEERTEQLMLSFCPAAIQENVIDGKYIKHVRPLEELTMQQLGQVIDHLKEIAATYYGTPIE